MVRLVPIATKLSHVELDIVSASPMSTTRVILLQVSATDLPTITLLITVPAVKAAFEPMTTELPDVDEAARVAALLPRMTELSADPNKAAW